MDASFLPLDQLPFDCLYCICEYLSAEELSRFSRACTVFHDVASSESLWRQQGLSRWQFCDVQEISSGEHRWYRYFQARRKLEAGMEQGKSGRDYRAKSLRAHEQDIVNVVTLDGSSVDWEHPVPPVIVSLSQDGVVHAWDVVEGKPVFSLEQRNITCLARDKYNHEIAVGDRDGHVTVYRVVDWSVKSTLSAHLEDKMKILSLEYGKINHAPGKTQSLLMVNAWGVDSSNSFIIVWDTTNPSNPLCLLSVNLTPLEESALVFNLSSSGWLAASTVVTDSVYVWLLPSVISSSPPPANQVPPPTPPLVTLRPEDISTPPFVWLSPGVLATWVLARPRNLHHHWPHPLIHAGHTSTMFLWEIAKFVKEQKTGQHHLYNNKSINLGFALTVVAYCHGVLVTGDEEGFVRIIDPDSGKVITQFEDHFGPVTDLYADRFRVLTCSKDYSIRVYRWKWAEHVHRSRPQLESRYQLLGGSVAHKTHDGFRQVTCTSTCCVGVVGNVIKLYSFAHHLPCDAQK